MTLGRSFLKQNRINFNFFIGVHCNLNWLKCTTVLVHRERKHLNLKFHFCCHCQRFCRFIAWLFWLNDGFCSKSWIVFLSLLASFYFSHLKSIFVYVRNGGWQLAWCFRTASKDTYRKLKRSAKPFVVFRSTEGCFQLCFCRNCQKNYKTAV